MKKKNIFLIFAFAYCIGLKADAQTQPTNAGFENWEAIGSFENPLGWSSFNNFYNYGVPEMSFDTSDSHSGSHALRLISVTATVPPPLGTNTLDTLAGFVFLGGFDLNNSGIPYTDRPISVQAFVKGTIISGSNAMIIATLSKWNTVTHVSDQVGMAVCNITSSIANYTQISSTFNYSLTSIPNTLSIMIMAGDVGSGGFILPGNEIFVDDISFTFSASISDNNQNKNNIYIFPNPASDKITVNTSEKINTIEIYNIVGEKVYSLNNFKQQKSNEINLSGINTGIYFVKIFNGEKYFTKKIIIQK
ncbi:MAG: T9SS type A sorting domain-containing protein [Bacteroidetes bacterium]|nr:T9SS type A sorting domain-containing protein [Bacteroidota bacterium]